METFILPLKHDFYLISSFVFLSMYPSMMSEGASQKNDGRRRKRGECEKLIDQFVSYFLFVLIA